MVTRGGSQHFVWDEREWVGRSRTFSLWPEKLFIPKAKERQLKFIERQKKAAEQAAEKAAEAEEIGRKVVDGYHFLVSIAPETKDATKDEYTKLTTESTISDFKHKGQLLEITFKDGSTYEYFGVNKNLYAKFVNSDKPFRFAKRNQTTTGGQMAQQNHNCHDLPTIS